MTEPASCIRVKMLNRLVVFFSIGRLLWRKFTQRSIVLCYWTSRFSNCDKLCNCTMTHLSAFSFCCDVCVCLACHIFFLLFSESAMKHHDSEGREKKRWLIWRSSFRDDETSSSSSCIHHQRWKSIHLHFSDRWTFAAFCILFFQCWAQ